MSSINPYYTFEYSQPREYHFSHDSVFLARRVFEFYSADQIADLRCLDLCSGCGIIGLDFVFHARKEFEVEPFSFDFVEVQEIYKDHFLENQRRLSPQKTKMNFVQENYSSLLDRASQYDLVVCNPPYFHPSQGTLSSSSFKNRCRFFLDSDFPTLIRSIQCVLAPGGNAFLLLREQLDHGWQASDQLRDLCEDRLQLEEQDPIRGTNLFRLWKPA